MESLLWDLQETGNKVGDELSIDLYTNNPTLHGDCHAWAMVGDAWEPREGTYPCHPGEAVVHSGEGLGLCLGRASLERKDLVRPMQEADPRLSFARVQRESDKGKKMVTDISAVFQPPPVLALPC